MKMKLLFTFLFIAFSGVISANAQASLTGKYYFDIKIDEGKHNFRFLFELKNKNIAVYSNEQDGSETQRRVGNWTYNKKLNQIIIILPRVKNNPMMGQETKLTFVFKVVGNKIKLIKDLPYKDGKGEIYQKL